MIMNVIPNNIQAKEFRYRAECRDQLQHKGDLYVGTGTTEEVTLDDGTKKNVQVTEPLYRTTDGSAPASDDSNQPTNGMALLIDNSNSKGWKIGQIETAGIKDGAITEVKLSKEYYIKNNSIDFAADRLTGALPHISWGKQSNIAGGPSTLILQAPLQSTERTTTILNLPITNSTGTLVTKEQLENGEIVAKTASSLKGNSSSQNQLFTSKKGTQNWAEFHEQSVLSTDGVTSIQLGPKDLTTSNGIISGTFFTPSVDNLGVGLYVVHDIGSHFFGIACIYDIGDQGEYGYDVALWGGIKMTNGKGTLKANTTLRALKIGWVNSLTSAANVFNALGLV